MEPRRKRTTQSLAVKAAELAIAVPQVIAHRVTRMALAGPRPSARDRREFERMLAEKNSAFGESWNAMFVHASRANQELASALFRSFMSLPAGGKESAASSAAKFHRAALGVLGKGLAPVHRKAMANAKRLSRTRLR